MYALPLNPRRRLTRHQPSINPPRPMNALFLPTRPISSSPSPGALRQGAWSFVPAPEVEAPLVIHWCGPLHPPAGGPPHIVAELARGHGRLAWHHPHHAPDEITDADFRLLSEDRQRATGWTERVHVIDANCLLARGTVRHPDYAPVQLDAWHWVHLDDACSLPPHPP